MTPEEIQRTIDGMLAVQRELQEGQLKIQENQIRDREQIEQILSVQKEMLSVQRDLQEGQMQMLDSLSRLIEVSDRHERRIEQLIGYSITGESDRLTLLERLIKLENRVQEIEKNNTDFTNGL